MSDGGKGSSPRPLSVSNEEYALRWDAVFSKDRQEELDFLQEIEQNKRSGLLTETTLDKTKE